MGIPSLLVFRCFYFTYLFRHPTLRRVIWKCNFVAYADSVGPDQTAHSRSRIRPTLSAFKWLDSAENMYIEIY